MSTPNPGSSQPGAILSGATTSAMRATSSDTRSPSVSTSPSHSVQDRLLAEFELNPIPDLDDLAAKLGLSRKTIRDFFSRRRRALGIDGRVPAHPPPGVLARRKRSVDSSDSDYQGNRKMTSPVPQAADSALQSSARRGYDPQDSTDAPIISQSDTPGLRPVTQSTSTSAQIGASSLDSVGRLNDYAVKCGVMTKEGKPCTRSLNCRLHNLNAKRAVQGRSKPFDTLLKEFLQVKEELLRERERNATLPVDPPRRARSSTLVTKESAASLNAEPATIPANLRINVPARTAQIPRFAPASSSLSEAETPSELASAVASPQPRAILPAPIRQQASNARSWAASSAVGTPATASTDDSASNFASFAGPSQTLTGGRGRGRGRGRSRGRGGRGRGRGAAARRMGRSLSEEASDDETGYLTGDEEYSASPSAEVKPTVHYPARASHRAAVNKTYREDSDESEMNSSDAENDFKSDAPAAALVTLASAEAIPVRQPSASAAPSEPLLPRPSLHPPRAPSVSRSAATDHIVNGERAGSETALARTTKPPLTYTSTTYHEGGAKLTHFHSKPVQSFWQEAPRPPPTFLEMRYGA